MASQTQLFNAAKEAALKAGSIIREVREKRALLPEMKGLNDPVTEADKRADAAIRDILLKVSPEALFVSEELSPALGAGLASAELSWIIDPLDGTVNFIHGLDQCGVSIAWAREGVVQGGLVYAPFREDLYSAMKGHGAFLNGQSIRASGCTTLAKALVGTGFPYARDSVPFLAAQLSAVLPRCQDIRRAGAASLDLCWVARGWLDAFYETLMPWDMAAGLHIAREAGAVHGRWAEPKTQRDLPDELCGEHLVVANPEVIRELLSALHEAKKA